MQTDACRGFPDSQFTHLRKKLKLINMLKALSIFDIDILKGNKEMLKLLVFWRFLSTRAEFWFWLPITGFQAWCYDLKADGSSLHSFL